MTGIWSVPGGHDSSSRWSDGASPTGFRPLSRSPRLLYFRYSRRHEPTVKHHKAPSTPLRRCRRRAVGTPHRRERLLLVHDSQLLASPSDDGQACSTAWKPVYGLAIRYDWFRARAGSCKRSDRLSTARAGIGRVERVTRRFNKLPSASDAALGDHGLDMSALRRVGLSVPAPVCR